MRRRSFLLVVIILLGTVTPSAAQVPDTGMLTEVTQFFRQASVGWAAILTPFMTNLLFHLTNLSLALFVMGVLFRIDLYDLLQSLLQFALLCGAATFFVNHGPDIVSSLFEGVKQISYRLGGPNIDPSAVAGYGLVIADPIIKATMDQGVFSYAMNFLTSTVFLGAGLSIVAAFAILALTLMSILTMSYFLIAAAPFFFAWGVLSFTRGFTTGYLRMVFGTMNALFAVLLVIAVISESGAWLEVQVRTQFLAPGVTLTWGDYGSVLVIGCILCGLFPSIPYVWAKAIDNVMPNWSSGGSMMAWGSRVVTATMPSGGGGSGGGGGGSGGNSTGGSPPPLAAPHGSLGSGGNTGARQPTSASNWSKKP